MAREPLTAQQALQRLEAASAPSHRAGMARYRIDTSRALGVPMPGIRAIAGGIVRDHALADQLWRTGIHEARLLAALLDRPRWVTGEQMDRWTSEFDSWDICDQVCGNLWDRAAERDTKIPVWAADTREFTRRAAFATIAWRAVHDKRSDDAAFLPYLGLVRSASSDDRNFVRKAVNWALRQIGKRSARLHPEALRLARELAESGHPSARWIGAGAVRELDGRAVRARLGLDAGNGAETP